MEKCENNQAPKGRNMLTTGKARRREANDKIKIIRPDNSSIETMIKGITFNIHHDILVGSNLTKDDVPIGSEVWLDEDDET